MSAHTPAPWHAASLRTQGDPRWYGCDIGAANNANVAVVLHQASDRGSRETVANAKLIAAAPDLLAALDEVLSHLQSDAMAAALETFPGMDDTNDEVIAVVRAALAKADL